MSWQPAKDPICENEPEDEKFVETHILPRTHDIGNFEVRRALPSKDRQMVGPFIFWDQMGPGEFLTDQGVDVRPHPHIGLSTITYLFSGTLDHKDSLGFDQRIKPGDVNVMTAGAGITHSERTGQDIRQSPSSLYGIQSWLALPKDKEEGAPDFSHIEKKSLPIISDKDKTVRLIAGNLYGAKSPLTMPTETIYADIHLHEGALLPVPSYYEERALYPLDGTIEIGGVIYEPMQLLVLRPGDDITIKALEETRIMLLGGESADGPRHIWWNFVSSSKERIEQAKQDWRERKFAKVPHDEEYIPLPE